MSHCRLPSTSSSGASTPTNSSSRPAPPPPATQRPVPAVPGRPPGGPPPGPPGGTPPGPPPGAPPSRPPPGPPPSRPPPGPPPKVRHLPLQVLTTLLHRFPAGQLSGLLLLSPGADGPFLLGRQLTQLRLQSFGDLLYQSLLQSTLTNVLAQTGLGYKGDLEIDFR